MKKVVLGFAIVVIVLLAISVIFPVRDTGYVVGSGGSGSSNQNIGNTCGQAPFNTDSKAQVCGKGCCFGTQTCYKGQVCCDSASEKGDDGGLGAVYFCKKICDAQKGQTECGEICCNANAGEVCRLQGVGDKKHGVCLKAEQARECNTVAGETACPSKGEVKECCSANQDCKSKYLRIPYTFVGTTIWGCSVNKNKAGGCGTDTYCQGTGKDFKEYAVCCKNPGEVCALHPDGQPYCYSPKQLPTREKNSVSWTDRIRSLWSWS